MVVVFLSRFNFYAALASSHFLEVPQGSFLLVHCTRFVFSVAQPVLSQAASTKRTKWPIRDRLNWQSFCRYASVNKGWWLVNGHHAQVSQDCNLWFKPPSQPTVVLQRPDQHNKSHWVVRGPNKPVWRSIGSVCSPCFNTSGQLWRSPFFLRITMSHCCGPRGLVASLQHLHQFGILPWQIGNFREATTALEVGEASQKSSSQVGTSWL